MPLGVAAQWQGYPTPRIPRTADGKANLTAPAPKTADGKPDLNGIWLASRAVFDLRQTLQTGRRDPVHARGKDDLRPAPGDAVEGRPERALPAHGTAGAGAASHAVQDRAEARARRRFSTNRARVPAGADRRPAAARGDRLAGVAGLFGRPLGRRHVRDHHRRFQREGVAGSGRAPRERRDDDHRALPPHATSATWTWR